MKRLFAHLLLLAGLLPAAAQPASVSGLNARQFGHYWHVESESPDYELRFRGDTVELAAPRGLTLWRSEPMQGDVQIDYDACVVVASDSDRLSDLNCFWMASDPQAPGDIRTREAWRSGIFDRCYSLQLYYAGFGGNYNTTTRFRRYDGDEAGVGDPAHRPAILGEYTDPDHLLEANRWYHITIRCERGRVRYCVDGRCLFDYRDPEPLTAGWFGFRTTLARVRIANFRCEPLDDPFAQGVPLHWIGATPERPRPVSFGVPFDPGELAAGGTVELRTAAGAAVATDSWPLAWWPDGSVKWLGVAGVMPAHAEQLVLHRSEAPRKQPSAAGRSGKANRGAPAEATDGVRVTETADRIHIATGAVEAWISRSGELLFDSIRFGGTTVGARGRLVCLTQNEPAAEQTAQLAFGRSSSLVRSAEVERAGAVRATVKLTGVHRDAAGREWLPFVVRLYFYGGSEEIRCVHSFVYDGDPDRDFIRGLGLRFDVPLRDELYNRYVAFSTDSGIWSEPVQPLVGRIPLTLPAVAEERPAQRSDDRSALQRQQMQGERIPPRETFDERGRHLLDHWAAWDGYRLSQLTADGFTIRKRATADNPWIGTFADRRSSGYAFAGDCTGGFGIRMHDFWESHPSSLEIAGARSDAATLTAWMWSPEAEPMDLRHYDQVAHDLLASYEDVQEGLSTPFGIARTTVFTLQPQGGYAGKADAAARARALEQTAPLLPTPAYLHAKQAFGIWSLPDRSDPFRRQVEERLDSYTHFYRQAVEQNRWYGFWNYGDFMHAYDPVRHTWLYDVGGFAWDNTELATNLWLWYSFLRSGDPALWRLAEAMTRHTAEVDVYHLGPNAGLGSRHNVSHWGCGAKEARISQALWNRCYYYLTTDERCGDLMTEVRDADQKLYTLDPMRLAEPRERYPCTAPARLRIGPDWLAYAGNWMTEWERTGNTAYRDKIVAGMESIAALPNRLFTGPLALGYDPATGIVTTECDPELQTTNHLMTIMGGFELMNELMRMIDLPAWNDAWLDHAARYKEQALAIRGNRFRISRLQAYGAWRLRDPQLAGEAWRDLLAAPRGSRNRTEADASPLHEVLPPEVPAPLTEYDRISTNDAATWGLDAIYMLEVIPKSTFGE